MKIIKLAPIIFWIGALALNSYAFTKSEYLEKNRTMIEDSLCGASLHEKCPTLSAAECKLFLKQSFESCAKTSAAGMPDSIDTSNQKKAETLAAQIDSCSVLGYFSLLSKNGKKCKDAR